MGAAAGRWVGAAGCRALLGSARYAAGCVLRGSGASRRPEGGPPVSVPVAAPATSSAPVRRAAAPVPPRSRALSAAGGSSGSDASASATGVRGRPGLRGVQLRVEKEKDRVSRCPRGSLRGSPPAAGAHRRSRWPAAAHTEAGGRRAPSRGGQPGRLPAGQHPGPPSPITPAPSRAAGPGPPGPAGAARPG